MTSGIDAPPVPLHRILVVDDSLSVRQTVREAFADDPQVEVHACGDVPEAEAFLARQSADLILCDAVLPGRPGYDLCRAITSNRRNHRPLVFLLSGAFEPFDEKAARASGADDVIAKPFRAEEIRQRLVGLLNTRGPGESTPGSTTLPDHGEITPADLVDAPTTPAQEVAAAEVSGAESATDELVRRMAPALAQRLIEPVTALLMEQLQEPMQRQAEIHLRRAAESQVRRRLQELEAEAQGAAGDSTPPAGDD